jgi:hypothetical protein
MCIATRVPLELTSQAMGIVIRSLYVTMLTVTAERPGVQGWALKAISFRGIHQLIVDSESFCTFLKPCIALCRHTRSSSLWDKTCQHRLVSPAAAVVPNYSPLSCVCNY